MVELKSRLAPREALSRIGNLLAEEGVKFKEEAELSLVSTATPIVILSIQTRLYSRKNWVGVNPFVFISAIRVDCKQDGGSGTTIELRINRRRALLLVVFWAICAALVVDAPGPDGALIFASVTIVAWLFYFFFVGGPLVKREIRNAVRA